MSESDVEWGIGVDEMFQVRFSNEELESLREALKDMANPVDVYVFLDSRKEVCRYCSNTLELLRIMSEASPERNGNKLVRHHVVYRDRDINNLFKKFNVSRVPTVALLDGVIKYTGMPAGEEVRGLVETIIRISNNESGLNDETKRRISSLKGRVHIEVIVTPTCPYCPYAALLANMFAFESYSKGLKVISSEIVEAYENPDIADKYGVVTVPVVVINGKVEFVGLPYEDQLLERVVEHSEMVYAKETKKRLINELIELLKEEEE